MTPEFKLTLTKTLLRIAIVLRRTTDVLSYLVTMYLAFKVMLLAIDPLSTEKDYLRLAAIALILICVEMRRG